MKLQIHTEIEIDAPASKVWEALTDSSKLKDWNPVMSSLEGDLSLGGKVRVMLHLKIRKKLKVVARLSKYEVGKELAWKGGVPGLMVAEHGFRIEALADDRVRFVHYEDFKGLMVLFVRGLLRTLNDDYSRMNEALKARAESL